MPRTLFEHLSPDTGPKRILALDGGGVKSMLTLGMLKVLEEELTRRAGGASGFRLSDYFDLIGGAGSGSVLATGLALGMSVDDLTALYRALAADAYGPSSNDGLFLRTRLDPDKLRRALTTLAAGKTLGSDDLRTGLAICVKRVDADDALALTNHPLGVDYDPDPSTERFPQKRYRLVDLMMASAGAPVGGEHVAIDVAFDENRRATARGAFVDAALGANNNPGLLLLSSVLDPAHKFGWQAGEDRLMMASCGAGLRSPALDRATLRRLPPALRAVHAARALVHDTQIQGVTTLQLLSRPRRPWPLGAASANVVAPVLQYQRLDVTLDSKRKAKRRGDPQPPMTPLERMLGRELDAETLNALDHADNAQPDNMDLLLEVGAITARAFVDAAYPDPRFDLAAAGA